MGGSCKEAGHNYNNTSITDYTRIRSSIDAVVVVVVDDDALHRWSVRWDYAMSCQILFQLSGIGNDLKKGNVKGNVGCK